MENSGNGISRRSFLGRGAAGILGAGLVMTAGAAGSLSAQEKPEVSGSKPSIREYRRLGRTGFKVSDISFGNAGMQDTSLLEYAMDRGINYVDTARQYYEMEVIIGRLSPSLRDKLFITTKLEPELFTSGTTEEQILAAIDDSLKRLNTDRIDCCLVHSVGDPNLGGPDRAQNPAIVSAFHKARKAGKIRFWGASSHGPAMVADFDWLLDNTDIDMIMPGMNFMTKGLEPVLRKAAEKDAAVVAMKSLSAARKIDYSKFMKEGRTARQALLKWTLAQPGISTIALTMRTFEEIDEFVGASGGTDMSSGERRVLEGYAAALDRDYCRPGCDGCLDACPQKVRIHDILRYRLYFNNYGREKYAMNLYAALPSGRNAANCGSCAGQCSGSCAFGLDIRSRLADAHNELTI